jgi:hypothetical protein
VGSLELYIIVCLMNYFYKCLLHNGFTWIRHNRLSNIKLIYVNVFYVMGSIELDMIVYLMKN